MLNESEPSAFEHLFAPVAQKAEELLWSDIEPRAIDNLNGAARNSLRHSLIAELANLCAPALYERFAEMRNVSAAPSPDAKPRQKVSTTNTIILSAK